MVANVCRQSCYFNSRPSARGDACGGVRAHRGGFISIHAPPRGATDTWSKRANTPRYFNSRPSARGDWSMSYTTATPTKYFNSRPSARGDVISRISTFGKIISIHAPPRGATLLMVLVVCIGYFNSRPSARGDAQAANQPRPHQISIHAPPRGATLEADGYSNNGGISIHAPPRGATQRSTVFSH